MMGRSILLALAGMFTASPVTAQDFVADGRALDAIVAENYAYLDRFADGEPPRSERLDALRGAIDSKRALIAYAEAKLLSLADHHAITGSSFADSWALVPSFADLWIVRTGERWVIDAVRAGSPADDAAIRPGDELLAISGRPVAQAVTAFWAELGFETSDPERDAFAARVLAAGRRDRPRQLAIRRAGGERQEFELPNLYSVGDDDAGPLTLVTEEKGSRIIIHDALGDMATIAAFDEAMTSLARDEPLVIDLRDTPGGGNTSVARAILGWFVTAATGYQIHSLPAEERHTGIARQWMEQVLPRDDGHHTGSVTVLVGRWTGSMGEGLAIGFDAIGADIEGTPMAGLRGAIYDFELPESGLIVKLPAERLMHVDGTPREAFQPSPHGTSSTADTAR